MPSHVAELYKDKIEVSLDGRQIFYLFFGGSVIVGMVFVLGVMVGRRVEARGHVDHARTSAVTDPLAALDRLDNGKPLSFHGALTGTEPTTEVDQKIDQLAAARAAKEVVDKTPDAKKADAKKADAKKAEDVKTDVKKADAKATDGKPADGKPAVAVAAKADDRKPDDKKADDKKADDKKADASYTLQLSSFQDKGEAEHFLTSVKSSGYQAQLTVAEVDGKGTFYRVRMGKYGSLDAAIDAKSDYEKSSRKTASIMKL